MFLKLSDFHRCRKGYQRIDADPEGVWDLVGYGAGYTPTPLTPPQERSAFFKPSSQSKRSWWPSLVQHLGQIGRTGASCSAKFCSSNVAHRDPPKSTQKVSISRIIYLLQTMRSVPLTTVFKSVSLETCHLWGSHQTFFSRLHPSSCRQSQLIILAASI